MKKACSFIAILLGLTAAPAFAAGGHFIAQLCGINQRENANHTGVNEVYQGLWTRADGSSEDAFLIRYFNGQQEIYLTSAKHQDNVLNILFYDVYNVNPEAAPIYLSFGVDQDNILIGDTSSGDEFAAKLGPTNSTASCSSSATNSASKN